MGCGGSKDEGDAKPVEATVEEAEPEPRPQELYKKAVAPPLPKGHQVLHDLVDLLDESGPGESIAAWLKEIDETRSRRKEIEAACDVSFAEFVEWVKVVEKVFAGEAVSIANLEKAWAIKRSTTALEDYVKTGDVRTIPDDQADAYRAECPVPTGADINELYKRATTPPLPKGHERLEAFIAVLNTGSAGAIYGWLKEIDETRSRRKEIENLSGSTFSAFREWVAICEHQLAKEVVSMANLEKAWKVGKYRQKDDERV